MHSIIIQNVSNDHYIPQDSLIKDWVGIALQKTSEEIEVTIRIVDKDEMTNLNSTYRKKAGPTNVLSFPMHLPDEIEIDIKPLGDIVICASVVNREATEQKKEENAHWAHMLIHGVLHLQGYDHQNDKDADIMESLEIKLLKELGFGNPYDFGEHIKDYE